MTSIQFLVADALDIGLTVLRGPEWGVYQRGIPVIQPVTIFSQQIDAVLQPVQLIASVLGFPNLVPVTASMVSFDFRQDWTIANYPVEQGGFASYDKVTRPYDVRLRMSCSGLAAKRQAFLQTVLTIANSTKLFDIVTPEMIFTNVNVSHISWPRNGDHGVSMIMAEIWFQKVRETGDSIFGSTLDPISAARQALGNVQASSVGAVARKTLFASGLR